MEGKNNFVESTIPLSAIKSAVELQHSHANMDLLNSLTTTGSAIQYLGGDGKYHDFPEQFYVDAFLLKYNQSKGNVTASKDTDGNLYMQATNTFASALGGSVIGSIELERASDKQINVSIAEVDVNSGAISENSIKYFTAGSGVRLNYADGILSFDLVQSEAPFTNLMEKQASATVGHVAVFDDDGRVIDGGTLLSNLVTASQLAAHADNKSLHVTTELQNTWNAKQNALTSTQLTATNSGITAAKVAQYDAYATNKQSVGGNTPNMNLITDAFGNITTEARFIPSTKINTVPTAVQNRVAIFTNDGNVKDSGIILGSFSSNETVKGYVDNLVNSSITGSSYQGTFTYFGTQTQVESVPDAKAGDTAIVYVGSIYELGGLLKGSYNGSTWTFVDVQPVPTNGAWMETDNLLGNDPVVPGRIIVKMDGVNPPALDVRPNTTMQLDNTTIGLNSAGQVSLMMRTLSSGKSVMNTITSDSIAYEFTNSGGTDTSKTIKEVIDANKAAAEPAFSKNTAFNKNFDTSSQSGTSTMVIGDKDTRLTNARPASDVSAWAKAATKPTYTYSEVGALGASQTAVAATKLETPRSVRTNLASTAAVNFDGTGNITPGVQGILPVANGGTGATILSSGYAIIGNGTSAVTFRAITDAATSESTALFTSGGAYTLARSKQNTISVSAHTPTAVAVSGNLWYQLASASGTGFTIRYYNGSSWSYLYPAVDPDWKAQVDDAIVNSGAPYVVGLAATSSTPPISGFPTKVWSGSTGNYSQTIAYSEHGKGLVTVGGVTRYLPKVKIYSISSGSVYEETYDSPTVNITTGLITIYSNVNTSAIVVVF